MNEPHDKYKRFLLRDIERRKNHKLYKQLYLHYIIVILCETLLIVTILYAILIMR